MFCNNYFSGACVYEALKNMVIRSFIAKKTVVLVLWGLVTLFCLCDFVHAQVTVSDLSSFKNYGYIAYGLSDYVKGELIKVNFQPGISAPSNVCRMAIFGKGVNEVRVIRFATDQISLIVNYDPWDANSGEIGYLLLASDCITGSSNVAVQFTQERFTEPWVSGLMWGLLGIVCASLIWFGVYRAWL